MQILCCLNGNVHVKLTFLLLVLVLFLVLTLTLSATQSTVRPKVNCFVVSFY